MPTISLSVGNDVPASVSLVTLARSDTGMPPAGVTPPLAFTNAGSGVWTVTFADASPSATYAYTFILTWADGSTSGPFGGTLAGSQGASGVYSTQADVEAVGRLDADIWSALSNDGTVDLIRFQSAVTRVDHFINAMATRSGYAVPIPATANLYARIRDLAVNLVLADLYLWPRGLRDKSDKLGGQLSQLRADAISELEDIFGSGVLNAARDALDPYGNVPSDVSPTTDGYGRPVQPKRLPNYGVYPWAGVGYGGWW